MRRPFVDTLLELMEKDERVMLVYMDVGFKFLERIFERFPNRCWNSGAAEQSAIAAAVGMSREGAIPFVYSMINFVVFRPYEQVRNLVAHGNANVKLFGVQGSEAYKFLGVGHNIEKNIPIRVTFDGKPMTVHQDEDMKLLHHLPNMRVHIPTSEQQVRDIMREEYKREGPAYVRI